MLLVWGRKWYDKKLGYVAEFCEICRAPQAFSLVRRELIGHFWYIPMGSHHATVHQGTCTACKTSPVLDRARYAAVAKKPAPVAELVALTFPNLEQVEQSRLAVERALRADVSSLPPQVRQQLIARPFVAVSPMVQARLASTNVDLPAALSLLSLAVLPAVGGMIGRAVAEDGESAGLLAGVALSAAAILWEFVGVNRRWVLNKVVPRLAQSLAPLAPSAAEIEGVIGELRKHGHKLGRQLKATDLVPDPAARTR